MVRPLALLLLAAAACVAPKTDPRYAQAGSGPGPDVTCHEVSDTGSLFSHTECSPVADQQARQDDTHRWLKKPRAQPSNTTY